MQAQAGARFPSWVVQHSQLYFDKRLSVNTRLGLVSNARTSIEPFHMREQQRKSDAHNLGMPNTKLTVYIKPKIN
jgi:hypothetical protein